jgi:general secretion pathway protein G
MQFFFNTLVLPFKRQNSQKGMTLIEIMIVLAILGGLIAVLAPNVMGRFNKSKVESTKLAMSEVSKNLAAFNLDCGKYPDALEFLQKPDPGCGNWGPEPYMKKAAKDAWGNEFAYAAEGSSFTLKSLGADKKSGGSGYDKDLSLDE